MRSAIITIVFGAALLLFARVQAESITLATNAQNSAVQPRDNKTDETQPEKDLGKQAGDDISSGERAAHYKGKPSPEKKPRLKYRDAPGCSC